MRFLSVLLFLLITGGQSMAQDVVPADFAAGYYLEIDRKSAVYSLVVPEEVYHTVRSADLSDVRVFNGAGQVVPHEFRTVKTDPAALSEKRTVPFFPLYQEGGSSDQAGISLQVSRDSGGAIVNIKTDSAADLPQRKLTGYLLDLSDLKKPAAELEFTWLTDEDSSVYTVNIQESSDLVQWSPLVFKATLANLQFGGQQVVRKKVSLPRQTRAYLKLTWQESSLPLRLTEALSYSRVLEKPRAHEWVSLDNGTVQEINDRLTVDFTTGYRLPASAVQLGFTETNSLARLSVQSRRDSKAGWRTQCEQVFYQLLFSGVTLQNEPCHFPPTGDPLWRVEVKQDGAGLHTDTRQLSLQLGWQPDELVFVGRGGEPYLLAFGSGKLAQQDKNQTGMMILQTMQRDLPNQMVGPARIGKKIPLGGEAALLDPAKPLPWKKWLLWAVLVLGVGLLAVMARSLAKEIKTAEEKQVSEDG